MSEQLDAFFVDWCERMERLREKQERAREKQERARELERELERWEPEGAAN